MKPYTLNPGPFYAAGMNTYSGGFDVACILSGTAAHLLDADAAIGYTKVQGLGFRV
jgi:hypothetical protein